MQKSRNLTRLKEKVFNSPLLITEASLLPITSYLKNPDRTFNTLSREIDDQLELLSSFDYSKNLDSYEDEQLKRIKLRAGVNPDTDIGLIPIEGTLVAKAGQIDGCTELTSYEKLKSLTALQIKLGVKSIVYNIDSGGGQAYLCQSTAKDLRKMADEAGIKTFAYVDGSACSAAYQMAVACHEIVANEDSDVGSIGVLIQLINNSKHLEKEGFERTFITAGDYKVPFDKDGSFQPEFIERLENSVSKTYDKFVKTVSELRGISEESIRATQARVYDADEALTLNLIDKIMEFEDFEKYVNTSLSRSSLNSNNPILLQEDNMSQQLTVEAVQAQLSAANEEKQQLADTLSGVQSQLAELTEAKESLSTELTALKEAKESLVAEKAALEAEKLATEKQARLDSRTAKLETALGKDNSKVAELLTTTESLSDEQFEVIASSFGVAQEAKQDQFAEKGGEGQQSNTQLTIEQKLAAKAKSMNKQSA